jgi:outer membrane protein assembly factor BamB
MRTHVLSVAAAVTMFSAVLPASAQSNPYRDAAHKHANALLEHGRDHYGRVHTPLFVQFIDLRTLEIPAQRTAAEWRTEMSHWKEDRNYLMWGKDRSSVLWAQDSNLLWDTENVRLFYALSKETGDPRYAKAADEYLQYFLKHCVSRTTGLFAWGEHIAYNVQDDEIHGQRHELQHSAPLWEEMWKFDPDAVRQEIEAVYRYHITDKRTMAFDRHANFWNGLPERDQATIIGYFGTYSEAFAYLYEKTADAKYLEWARKLLMAFQSKSNAEGLYSDNWTDRQQREQPEIFPTRPNLAASMYHVFERTHDRRWLDDGNRYLEACDRSFRSRHAAGDDRVYGPVRMVDAALLGYKVSGNPAYLDMANHAGAELLQREQPHAQMASTLADSMDALRRLYEATHERRWLEGARKLGDYALRTFVHPSGLIRGTAIVDRPDYYDSIQGPGALALSLYRLGIVDEDAAPVVPKPPQGDQAPPAISDLEYSHLASNQTDIPVHARISDASGIGRATLQYAYGTEIGFEDSHPEVAGDRYTFHIQPPGTAFTGEVLFSIEAVDRSPNENRALTPWRRIRLATYDDQRAVNGAVRFLSLGASLTQVSAPAPIRAWVTSVPPEGTAKPTHRLRSTGRYLCFADETLQAGRITLAYGPEETLRLIESTLSLAYWEAGDWHRTPSQLDREGRRVSAAFHKARYWTLLGEDRVLWRAPGRQGGTALAHLDQDRGYQVATVLWMPGELLSSAGKPIRRFPIDPPYHPLVNPSPPIVASLAAGQEPLLLFGAPAGYVYAYDRLGKLRWRTEVGGEILNGVAVGRLADGPASSVVASWSGGVAAIDASGHLLWQKDVPKPSGSVPVLVDLDADGKLDVVVNAGSGIVALKGDTGAILWTFSIPGAQFITPAAGAFGRNGNPRIVSGDHAGVIYAIDEKGKLLWRQHRVFSPREVPEPIDQYAAISEIALADLDHRGERQIIASTKSGETVSLSARGERLWRFTSFERQTGTSLTCGAHLAFADLDNDGKLEVVVSQQDSYLYVLDFKGRQKWAYLGHFWYHSAPTIADLEGTGELNIVFTAPEEDGTYALRSGFRGPPGRAPWPTDRGTLQRTNCAPW